MSAKTIRRLSIALILFVALSFVVNALIIFGFTPSSVDRETTTHQGISVTRTEENLQASGMLRIPAYGYVNVTSPESKIFLTESPEKSSAFYDMILSHEAFHLVQKEYIAEKSGGYPTLTNPVRTVKFLYNAWKLNNQLEKAMPPVKEGKRNPFTSGLEASADCAAQDYAFADIYRRDRLLKERKSRGWYIKQECSPEQKKIVRDMMTNSSLKTTVIDLSTFPFERQ